MANGSGGEARAAGMTTAHEELLQHARDAAARWPGVVVDVARVADVFAQKLAAEAPGTPASALQHADLYLALACSDGDARAWRVFEETHLRSVARYVARIDSAPAFAAEVQQRLAERLLPRLHLYSGRGPLAAWVRVAAVRVARDLKRSAPDEAHASEADEALASPLADAEMTLAKRELGELFQATFREALAALSTAERNLLRLHYLDGLTLEEVGKAYGVSRATAARSLQSARHSILQRVRQSLKGRVSSSSPSSMFAFVRSQLDVSMRRFLT